MDYKCSRKPGAFFMFDTASTTQIFLQAFGLYLIATAIGLMLTPNTWRAMLEELRDSAAMGFVLGLSVFSIGVVVLALHNDWSTLPATIVTVFGWAALIKGLSFIALPKPMMSFASRLIPGPGLMRIGAVAVIALGAWLMAMGLGLM
jgi:uncharacterized protein YjeT (DUF2065 family)